MPFSKSAIKKILVISLSNLGDVILTFPVMDILKKDFPAASLSVVVGPKAVSLFEGNPHIKKVYVFEKDFSNLDKLRWVLGLRKEHFDLAVDLRNTAIPWMAGAKYRTPLQTRGNMHGHRRLNHLRRLKSVVAFASESAPRCCLSPLEENRRFIDGLLRGYFSDGDSLVAVSPGAANHIKRWTQEGFAAVCDELAAKYQRRIVLVGDEADKPIAESIKAKMRSPALNLAGRINLTQLAELLSRASLVLANDSGVMHMASYLDRPIVAIFGPTDPRKYGPWSSKSSIVRRELFCSPCEKSGCAYQQECMKEIPPEEVLAVIKRNFLNS